MPVVVPEVGLIVRPEEAVELLKDLIVDNAERLGIEFVGSYDERLIPRYPAVVVSAGQLTKEVHATHTFALTLRCTLWVYHAQLTLTHTERTEEDLLLSTALVALLEDDKTFSNKVVFSFVESEIPGLIRPRTGVGERIIGTQLLWEGTSQQRWD